MEPTSSGRRPRDVRAAMLAGAIVSVPTNPAGSTRGDGPQARAYRRAAAQLRLIARWIDRPTGPLTTHLHLHLRVLALDTRAELARIAGLVALVAFALLLAAALDALLVTMAVLAVDTRATQLAVLAGALLLHALALAVVLRRMRRLRDAAAAAYAATRAEFAADLDLLRSLR